MAVNPEMKGGMKLHYYLAKEQGVAGEMVLAPKHDTSGSEDEGPILPI